MAEILTVVWFAAAGGGLVAVLVAVARPDLRRPALLVAAAAFGIAGVLGILSIGVVFLVGAIVCGVVAARASARSSQEPADAASDASGAS